jgi:Xaa-Pro aminopeptidase
MFDSKVYAERRNNLRKRLDSGLVLLPGNQDASMNYSANIYHFRQDSTFLYFFGLNQPQWLAILDIDENKDYLFADDITMDDIIWMGFQPTVAERAAQAGVFDTAPIPKCREMIQNAINKGRKIHILPPYRGKTLIHLEGLLGTHHNEIKSYVSNELIKEVVALRSVKDSLEIAWIEKALETAYYMHTTAMKMAKPGVVEREIAGTIEGIALAHGGPVSFPVILSTDGQTLHNHYHGNTLAKGRMMLTDAGAETEMHYCSDITRTVPVGGKFDSRQKDIYQIVLKAEMDAIEMSAPGIYNRDVHLKAARIIADGLKDLGLMKGDMEEAVRQGAHALFFVHGLGHMMGLDVHDMEGLGENFVGYDETVQRSSQFGLAFLRLAKKLEPGFVLTVEPGIYFIPALIDQWKAEKKCAEFLNYDRIETFKDFGGIRIEDDILITQTGRRILGTKPIPKTCDEIEQIMQ